MKRPTWTMILTAARKFGVALVGLAATALAQGLLPEQWRPWAAVVVALGTALGVYGIGNTSTPQRPQG